MKLPPLGFSGALHPIDNHQTVRRKLKDIWDAAHREDGGDIIVATCGMYRTVSTPTVSGLEQYLTQFRESTLDNISSGALKRSAVREILKHGGLHQ